jgi:hypothetical protein
MGDGELKVAFGDGSEELKKVQSWWACANRFLLQKMFSKAHQECSSRLSSTPSKDTRELFIRTFIGILIARKNRY